MCFRTARPLVASWEIAGGKLYLHDVEGTIGSPGGTIRGPGENSRAANLAELFPGESIPVFASWFQYISLYREHPDMVGRFAPETERHLSSLR